MDINQQVDEHGETLKEKWRRHGGKILRGENQKVDNKQDVN